MAIQQSKLEPHWNYFLAIERDLDTLSRYVEFDRRNFECFSIEMARVLLSAGAEADVVCKQVCRMLDGTSQPDNIHDYRNELSKHYPAMVHFRVRIPRFELELKPWEEWSKSEGVPVWWTAYNKTKHERSREYHRANLKNTLNAVAGLFVAAVHLYPDKARSGKLLPSPLLLRPHETHISGVTHNELEFGFNYVLK